jgi:hypothetical protein
MGTGRDSWEAEPAGGLVGQTVANYHVLALSAGRMGALRRRHACWAARGREGAAAEFSNNRDLVVAASSTRRARPPSSATRLRRGLRLGQPARRSAYLIMDYLRGASLATDRFRARSPSPKRCRSARRRSQRRLRAPARDRPPRPQADNIFLAAERPEGTTRTIPTVGDEVTVKVLDFGIAKLGGGTTGSGDGRQSARTRIGVCWARRCTCRPSSAAAPARSITARTSIPSGASPTTC